MPRNVSELKSGGGDNSYAVPPAPKSGGTRPPVPHRSTPVAVTDLVAGDVGHTRHETVFLPEGQCSGNEHRDATQDCIADITISLSQKLLNSADTKIR